MPPRGQLGAARPSGEGVLGKAGVSDRGPSLQGPVLFPKNLRIRTPWCSSCCVFFSFLKL